MWTQFKSFASRVLVESCIRVYELSRAVRFTVVMGFSAGLKRGREGKVIYFGLK